MKQMLPGGAEVGHTTLLYDTRLQKSNNKKKNIVMNLWTTAIRWK